MRTMTLARIIALLSAALVVMLAVVVLRAEATRVHHEICELERREDELRPEVRREWLALQRARNPSALLERLKGMEVPVPAETEGDGKQAGRGSQRER
jgi:hypothetical protein